MVKKQAPVKPEELLKILENKFGEFKEFTLSKLNENENECGDNKKSITEAKENFSKDFLEVKSLLELIQNDIENRVATESQRSESEVLNMKKELSTLIEDKIGSLKWEVTAKLSSIAEVVEFQEKSSSKLLNQLEDHISWKMKEIHQNLKEEMKKVSKKVQQESSCQNDTKEQIGCLAAMIDEINEKLYDFEASKRNNLIFYGIASDTVETPFTLQEKVITFLYQDSLNSCFRC